jgi:serine/threonine protein kinase
VETWRVGENYRLVSVLGCGSFGAVVKSFDARSSRFVALKRVPDALTTVDAAKRVLREVVVLNRLDHPNIIKIFDIFFTPATSGARVMDPNTFSLVPLSIDLYMAFEIAEGGDLYEMRGEMTAREVRSLMRQLTSAVLYLHAEGVWHRDIKSANTLCGQTRVGGRVVKICDFGLARGAKAVEGSRGGYTRDDDARMSVNDADPEADLARDAAREARRRRRRIRLFVRVVRVVGGHERSERRSERDGARVFLRAAGHAHDRRRDAVLPRAGGDHEQRRVHRRDGRLGAGVHLRRAPAAPTAARVDPQPDHFASVPVRR